MEPKIREAVKLIDESGFNIDLEVDGGISPDTISGAAAAGARVLVAGSALYKHEGGLKDAVSTLRRLAEAAIAA
jgi:ribulose-phosphate 3-epimerase